MPQIYRKEPESSTIVTFFTTKKRMIKSHLLDEEYRTTRQVHQMQQQPNEQKNVSQS